MGCVLIRHGGRHDWYQNPQTGESQPVPRHVEINEQDKHIEPGPFSFVSPIAFSLRSMVEQIGEQTRGDDPRCAMGMQRQ